MKNDTAVINGTLRNCGQTVSLSIHLVDKKGQQNLLKNPDFENLYDGMPEHWAVEAAGDNLVQEVRQEISEEFPFGATNYYYFKSESNFKWKLCQKFESLPAGNYTFSLAYRGDNTTGVKVKLYARTAGEVRGTVHIPVSGGMDKAPHCVYSGHGQRSGSRHRSGFPGDLWHGEGDLSCQ